MAMEMKMRAILRVCLIGSFLITGLTACATVDGVGRDVSATGKAIERGTDSKSK